MTDPSQPRRRRRKPAPEDTPPPVAGSAVRGIVLVLAAFIVGVVLLRDDSGVASVGTIGAETVVAPDQVDDGETGDDGETAETTTTTIALRPESSVKVIVANGSGVNGAAGSLTDQLQAFGYLTGTPTNADGRVPATVIYYVVDHGGEAERLATQLGAAPTAVTPMPTPAPIAQLEDSQILVVLGPDLAPAG